MPAIARDVRETRTSGGFTLVELLIVISIIGVLVAMLMPAVQSARESGRRAKCLNNLHQMALGCLAHEAKYQYLPSGGWGFVWGGEPDRGFGVSQPGGWHYNILPFIDLADLHDLGKGLAKPGDGPKNNTDRFNAGTQIAQTPVAIFICPTRRKVQVYPDWYNNDYANINPYPTIARSDYAANAGSMFTAAGQVAPAMNTTYSPAFDFSAFTGTINSTSEPATGVIFRASALPLAKITDGAANTYLIGERYLSPDEYNGGNGSVDNDDDDQGWDQGYDYDTIRGTGIGYLSLSDLNSSSTKPSQPFQDRPGVQKWLTFGSAHEAGFNMAFCDGAARLMPYTIDPTTHMQLGHRSDGQPTQLDNLYK
jgi:prepilin-type N-terminal cleavage/methylation domain-containing protein